MVNRAFPRGIRKPDEPDFKRRCRTTCARERGRRCRFNARSFGSRKARAARGRVALPRRTRKARCGTASSWRRCRSLRELIGPRTEVDRDALERARAQIAEAQAYKHELGLIYAAVERTRTEMTALGAEAHEQRADRARRPRACRHRRRHRAGDAVDPAGGRGDRPGRQRAVGVGQGRPRAGARARHPGSRGADFRGLQFPGPHRPARRPCAGDAEVRRGARRPAAGDLARRRAVQAGRARRRRPRTTAASSTARSSPTTAATPRRTTSTACSAAR